jgi:transcription initiation factor TFIIB
MTEDEYQIEEIVKCPECGSRKLDNDDDKGETVCNDCGLVLEENRIDPGPEWRNYQSGEDNARASKDNRLVHDKDRGSTFNWREMKGRSRSQYYRMEKWQKRARVNSSVDRNLSVAFVELKKIGTKMGIGNQLVESASEIYKKAVLKGLIRGRSIEAVVAASLYGALRMNGTPRPLPVMASYSRVGQKEIGRTWRLIRRELKLKTTVPKPEEYIQKFTNDLGMSSATMQVVYELLTKAKAKDFDNGRSPIAIAAGAIYIASVLSNQRRTQAEIAAVCGVTEVTIRNCYKQMVEMLDIDFNEV